MKKYYSIFFVVIAVVLAIGLNTPQALPAVNPRPDVKFPVTDGQVDSIAADPANHFVYFGGHFNTVGAYNGTGVVVSSSTSALLSSGNLKIVGEVKTVITDGSGGWYVGGAITNVNSQAVSNLVHLNADYSVDTNFSSALAGEVDALVLDTTNGYLYVGGVFTGNLTKLNAVTGAAVGGFSAPASPPTVYSLALDVANNHLYVGSYRYFHELNATTGANISAFDATALTSASARILSLALDSANGFIYVGSDNVPFSKLDATTGAAVTKSFNPPSFDGAVNSLILDITTNHLFAGGAFAAKLVEFDAGSGNTVLGFTPPAFDGTINSLAWDAAHNYLYVGGNFTNQLVALDSAGATVVGFTPPSFNLAVGSTNYINALSLDAVNGKVFVGGQFTILNGVSRVNLVKINTATGAVVSAFNASSILSSNLVFALALDSANNHLYVGGSDVKELDAITGDLIPAFSPTSFSVVETLALDSANNHLYVGGFLGGGSGVAKIDSITGSAVSGFVGGASDGVTSLLLDSSNGYLYAGGNISGFLKKFDAATGAAVPGFNASSIDNVVSALAFDSANNCLYVGGSFGGNLTKLDAATGAAVSGFSPTVDNQVNGLAFDSNSSRLFVGGTFTGNLTEVNADTGAIVSSPPSSTTGVVNALNLNHNYLYVGGTFNFINSAGVFSNFLALPYLDQTPPVITLVGSNPVTISQNSVYTEAGAQATDIHDGNLTNSIVITNSVNLAVPGTYAVTYSVTDLAGNLATATRTVIVTAGGSAPAAFFTLPNTQVQATPDNPKGELTFTIDNNQAVTNSRDVTLKFLTGQDVVRMAISEDPNFSNISQEPLTPTKIYHLISPGSGLKTIYLKFYNQYGQSSAVIAKTIDLQESVANETQTPPVSQPINPPTGSNVSNITNQSIFDLLTQVKLGQKNDQVKQLQQQLKDLGLFPAYVKITGYYGSVTERAVKNYQLWQNQKETIGGLIVQAKPKERSVEVKSLQTWLKRLDFFPWEIMSTGYYGPITLKAVASYLNFLDGN